MKTLASIPAETDALIQELSGDPVILARLRELGFVRGEKVRVSGKTLFGDPILVEVRGATVALRKQEAQCVRL